MTTLQRPKTRFERAKEIYTNLKTAEDGGWFKTPRTRKEVAVLMTYNSDTYGASRVSEYVKRGILGERAFGNVNGEAKYFYTVLREPLKNFGFQNKEVLKKAHETRAKNGYMYRGKKTRATQPNEQTPSVATLSTPQIKNTIKLEANGVTVTTGVEDAIKIIKALK